MEATQEHGQRPLQKAPHLRVFGASTGTLLPTSRQLTRPWQRRPRQFLELDVTKLNPAIL